MNKHIKAKQLIAQATNNFPFSALQIIKSKKPQPEHLSTKLEIYSQECRFDVCPVLSEFLLGEGSIECRFDEAENATITASCTLFVQGDNKRKSELGIFDHLEGHYDIDSQIWTLSIDVEPYC